jgi:ATP-binding cassette, subfamily B, bacterial
MHDPNMSRVSSTSLRRFRDFRVSARKRQDPRTSAIDAVPTPGGFRYLRGYSGWLIPHRRMLALIVALALVGIAIDMLWPLVSRHLIDDVILNPRLPLDEKLSTLARYSGAMILLFVVNSSTNLWRSFRMQLLNSRLSFSLRSRLFERILHLPMHEITEMKTGGVISRLSNDVDNTTGLLQMAFLSPALSSVRLIATLSIIFTLNWQIAAAVMLSIPPIMLAQHLWIRRIRVIWKSMGQDRSEIDGRVSEGLNGIRVVRGFARELKEQVAYTIGHHTVIRKQLLATGTQRSVALIWDLILPLTQVTIIWFGGYLVLKGQATIGTLIAFQGYVWRLLDPIMQIVSSISETQRGLAALERVFDVFEKPAEKPDPPAAVEAPERVREIRFEHVSFGYREDTPVIRDFDLSVPGGSVVALVGPSGAGKTTLTDLVARFHDPSAGRVLVNGVDLRQIKLKSYRGLLGIVQQEVFLFDGSVRDNIAYARTDATEREILDAAARANAHEFIDRLPNGYDTLIGERGVKLSGGQRQRLSIARALLASPEILILDEATSNLDTESEQLIQAAMKELLKNRTTFVIAHRLSTITHADTIVVLDRGTIIELGRHEQLMHKRGAYFHMVERQRQAAEAEARVDEARKSRPGPRAVPG